MSQPAPADGTAWQESGRLAAPTIDGIAAAVVLGRNAEHAAHVAVGMALALCGGRQVVLADLVGELEPLYALAGGEDALGLTDCLRDDVPLNDVARRALAHDGIFVLPAGTPPVATRRVLGHERWPKLVRGFAEAGALLLIVAPLDADGVEQLVAATQGVIAVDTPPQLMRRFPVLVSVPAPAGVPTTAAPFRGRPRKRRLVALLTVLLTVLGVALATGGLDWWRQRFRGALRGAPRAVAVASTAAAAGSPPPPRVDTIRLGDPVNAADSASAAFFAVEVVAANTLAGANSVLRDGALSLPLPATTVAPVAPGGGTIWYQALVGAWRTRTGADSLLAALRERGVLREGAGRVVRRPYALLLQDGASREVASATVQLWQSRGVGAYALEQEDGRVRVFAGAFDTPLQAASLAASVRDAGTTPVMAIRTGRAY